LARSLIENIRDIRQSVGMKLSKFFTVVLAAAFLAGCKKAETAATTQSPENWQPTQAQPKLPTMKIYLGAETLDAELALTPKEDTTGMMFRTNILETDAMLFVFPFPQRAEFWMKNCPESISAAYIDPSGVIQEIHHLEKEDTNTVSSATENIGYVLETKDGWFARHNINTGTVIRTEKGSLGETFFGK
jgi:uncharacterized membrane protein (UPF0127 family)